MDEALHVAALAVQRGGVVGFPTETYYGLAADPRQASALREVLRLKGRDARDKPLLLLAASLDDVAPWVQSFPAGFDALVARFWPGPLTLVLPATETVPTALRGPSGGVGVRLTSHPLARRFIAACGTAVTGTSANRTGAAPARDAVQVQAAFGGELAAVLDGGETAGGAASTVVELRHEGARLLRTGAVPEATLREVVRLS